MLKKAGLISVALMVAACSGGGGSNDTTEIPGPGVPPPPPTTSENTAPQVSTAEVRVQVGEALDATIAVTDPDGDSTSISLVSGPDWLSVTANGLLSGTPTADHAGTDELIIDVSDGEDTTRATITVSVFMDPIEQALQTGDYSFIESAGEIDVPTVLLDEIERIDARNRSALNEIYQLNADGSVRPDSLTSVNWTPWMAHSSVLHPTYPYHTPLFAANRGWRDRRHPPLDYYGLIGFLDSTRYLVLGNENALNGDYQDESHLHKAIKNTINWMVQTDTSDGLNVVVAHFNHDEDAAKVRNWLDSAFPDSVSYNRRGECDNEALSACLTDNIDLMIISQRNGGGDIAERRRHIERAMNRGVALIYIDKYTEWSPFGTEIKDLLGELTTTLSYPFVTKLVDVSPHDHVYGVQPELVTKIKGLVEGIEAGTLNYDLSACSGTAICLENEAYHAEVYDVLRQMLQLVRDSDHNKRQPFETQYQNRFLAALLLTGDYYRSVTSFPMPRDSTSSNEIIRALFGEYAAIISRKFNPVMPDMGTFSRSEFSDGLLGDAQVVLTSAPPYKTSGLYALPGETVTVTRNDNNEVETRIQLMTSEDNVIPPFRAINNSEYVRPTRVASNQLRLAPDETIWFTSAFGGPIHIWFNQPGIDVDLTFTNVATHPVWRGPEDNEKFQIGLAAEEFDWAEIVTPNFEIHATLSSVREALTNFATPAALADAAKVYLRDRALWLNGENGDGIQENPDLIALNQDIGLALPDPNTSIQHWNVGQSACEISCGTNPYDSQASADPLSFESQRALGNALKNELLRLTDGPDDAIADLFATHGAFRGFQQTGEATADCRPLPFEAMYALIQDGHASGNPAARIKDEDVNQADEQNALYVQLMAALQAQGAFDDGWAFLPRLHLMTRLMRDNRYSGIRWPEHSVSLGFGNSPWYVVRDLSYRGRQLILISQASQRNILPYMEMWGYEFENSVKTIINRLGYPSLEPAYYAIGPTDHCTSLDHPELPVDGISTWPAQ